MKEWLLIAWLGTTTNFSLLSIHFNLEQCQSRRAEIQENFDSTITLVCVQDFREGRSQYPSASKNVGIAK
jgi:hypothetical protein